MSLEWSLMEEAYIPEDHKIVIPDNVRKHIEKERALTQSGTYGPSVYWNVETNAEFVVLSKLELRKPNYDPVRATKILIEEGEYVTHKIRPPKGVGEKLSSQFIPGGRVFYLAYEGMLQPPEDPVHTQSIYLLTEAQLYKMLPNDELGERETTLKDRVLNTPGFLPSI